MNVMGHLPGLAEVEVARRFERAAPVVRRRALARLTARLFVVLPEWMVRG